MSKVSLTFIGIMITALLFMGAVRGYQFYAHKSALQQEERQQAAQAFTFHNVPLRLAPPQPEPSGRPQLFSPPKKDIFLEDVALTPEKEIQQAQETLQSVLEDYQDDKNLQSFNQALSRATQGQLKNLADLGGGNLAVVLQQNPQVAQLVEDYMKNPDFAHTIEEIFSNPQFVQSVERLQKTAAPAHLKKTDK